MYIFLFNILNTIFQYKLYPYSIYLMKLTKEIYKVEKLASINLCFYEFSICGTGCEAQYCSKNAIKTI
jgi:hypothetical protein